MALRNRKLYKSQRFSYAYLRANKTAQVTERLRVDRSFAANQGAIWSEIDRKHRTMGTSSRTAAITDIYESYDDILKKYTDAFSPLEGQLGVGVFINNSFVCLDVFDSHQTLVKLYSKLIESCALDAMESQKKKKKQTIPDVSAMEKIIKDISESETESFQSVGIGEDLRIKAKGLIGSCLILEGKLIHLAVFYAESRMAENRKSNLSSPSARRRNLS